MKSFKLLAMVIVTLLALSVTSNANTDLLSPDLLSPDDLVGISFWVISMGLLAATAFFFFERRSVASNWRITLTVSGIITGVAFINYLYLRNIYVSQGEATTLYRYIDWIITMPLQVIQFYLILSTVRKVQKILFWKLLIGTVVMVLAAYLGASENIHIIIGLTISLGAWIYILYEIFSGEAGSVAAKSGNKTMVNAYVSMRMIITAGWAIYPLGYIFSYITNSADDNLLNIVYNMADFINKIAFGLIIWAAAKENTTTRNR